MYTVKQQTGFSTMKILKALLVTGLFIATMVNFAYANVVIFI